MFHELKYNPVGIDSNLQFTRLDWMEAEMLLMYSYSDASDALTLVVRLTVLVAVILTVPLTHFPVSINVHLLPNEPMLPNSG